MKGNIMVTTTNSNDCIIIQIKEDDKMFPIGIAEASLMSNDMYYFNRLYVNQKYRRKNYGTKLLNTMLDYIDSIKGRLYLDINPYGDMNYEQLKLFYMRYGFKETDEHRLLYETGGRNSG
jgi:GNAT superfamily N-acetyltransferase